MRYMLPQELKAQTKVFKDLYFKDLLFIIVFNAVMLVFKNRVSDKIQTLYMLYNIAVSIILVSKPSFQPQKRLYQSFYYLFIKDKTVYKPISYRKDTENDVL